MRKNILRVAMCAVLFAGINGCGFQGDDGERPPLSQPPRSKNPTIDEFLKELGPSLQGTLRVGKLTLDSVVDDSGVITCTGCVRQIKPNDEVPKLDPCTPECPPALIASEKQEFEQGVAVLRAVLAARHRGVELKVVLH